VLLYLPCCWVGGAGVLPPASNTSSAVQMSPGKKQRGSAAMSAAPSTTTTQMLSVPLMPNTVPHPLTAVDALPYFPRQSESLEQIQRNQLLHRQMLIAAGQQLTPVCVVFNPYTWGSAASE